MPTLIGGAYLNAAARCGALCARMQEVGGHALPGHARYTSGRTRGGGAKVIGLGELLG